jgi:hypothetical protein
MGLDIYLKRYDDFKATRQSEEEYEKLSNKIWEEGEVKYDDMSDEEKESRRSQVNANAQRLGLNTWGSDEANVESIEEPHPCYPDHYFKIGYFRSSYNDSGIERILGNMGVPTLSEIFSVENEDYYIQPNWEESLERVNSAIEKLKVEPAYRIKAVGPNIFRDPDVNSEQDAMAILKEKLNREKHEYNYSCSEGEFSIAEPQKIVALIPGYTHVLRKSPCVYVVTESDNTWYIEALEIVKSTIEYVLSKDKREQYYLHWSG